MQGKENILKDLDYLKVIGILLVVIGHCTSIYTGGWVYKSPVNAPIYGLIASYVYTFHVPMLVFVSGAIYYYCRKNKEKYKSLKGLVSNKFKRLIVPFLTIGLFYSIPIKYLIGNIEKGTLLNSIRDFLIGLNTGHLWYLLMLFDIFILFYLYEKFILNKKYSVIVNIAVFTLMYVCSGFFTSLFLINRAIQYSIFFYLGYECFRSKDKIYSKMVFTKTLIIIILIPILIIISLALILVSKITIDNIILSRVFSLINVIIALIGITETFLAVYLLNNKLKSRKLQSNIDKCMKFLNKYSFNIYLLHEPLIFIILSYIASKNINSTILVLACFIVSIVIPILLTKAFQVIVNRNNVNERVATR